MSYRENMSGQAPRPVCPHCASMYIRHDGNNSAGELRYKCKPCGERFSVSKKPVREKSGVFPEPCRGREFVELRRNPFEMRDLAMVLRNTK